MELRLPLDLSGQPIALALFADSGAGTVLAPPGAPRPIQVAAGAAAGVGLRYGPLKFDLAWNAQGARKLHVGLAGDGE